VVRIPGVWNEHMADPYLPRTLSAQLGRAGFRVNRLEVIPLLNSEPPAPRHCSPVALSVVAYAHAATPSA
jgi:hypothetical protein